MPLLFLLLCLLASSFHARQSNESRCVPNCLRHLQLRSAWKHLLLWWLSGFLTLLRNWFEISEQRQWEKIGRVARENFENCLFDSGPTFVRCDGAKFKGKCFFHIQRDVTLRCFSAAAKSWLMGVGRVVVEKRSAEELEWAGTLSSLTRQNTRPQGLWQFVRIWQL